MSMESSFVYGYGFYCDCEEGKLIDFIKEHKNTFCRSDADNDLYNELIEYTKDQYDLEDFFDCYYGDSGVGYGKEAVVANVISRETEIGFIGCPPDEDHGASIIFEASYPWLLNEKEKNVTKEDLKKICKKYMKELDIQGNPDFLNLEYYG